MITFNINEFIASIQRNTKLLCVDPGTKNIGIALSDAKQLIVVDIFTYKVAALNDGVAFISERYFKEECSGIIVGIPFTHTRENNWIESIMDFAKKIMMATNSPVYLKDESYSTQSANFFTQNFSRKNKKKHKDRLAAYCILQDALDIIRLYIGDFRV